MEVHYFDYPLRIKNAVALRTFARSGLEDIRNTSIKKDVRRFICSRRQTICFGFDQQKRHVSFASTTAKQSIVELEEKIPVTCSKN